MKINKQLVYTLLILVLLIFLVGNIYNKLRKENIKNIQETNKFNIDELKQNNNKLTNFYDMIDNKKLCKQEQEVLNHKAKHTLIKLENGNFQKIPYEKLR